MLIQVQRPHKYSFSKNQMLWRFYTNRPSEDGCMIEVRLSVKNTDGTGEKLYYTKAKPGADGFCNFYLQDIIDSMIEYEYPGNAVINIASNIKIVNLTYRRTTTADNNDIFVSVDNEIDFYVIKGGIEDIKFDYNNYFINLHTPNKPFATWLPNNRFVSIEDDFYLSLLFVNDFAALDTTQRKIRVTAEWTDSTTDTLDIDFDNDLLYLLYHIKADARSLGIDAVLAAGRTLYRYKLQVVNTATPSTVYTEVYTFYIDYRQFYKSRVFYYYNSLGGLDYCRVLGDTEENYNRQYSEAEKINGFVEVGSGTDTEYIQTGISRSNSFKSDVGYRNTAAEITSLQELLNSWFIWQVFTYGKRRVWLLNRNGKVLQNSDTVFNFPLEWRYGFTEQVYSPEVAFGAGLDAQIYAPITCPIPTGLSASNIGTSGPDTIIQFNWATEFNADAYVLEYKASAATNYTVNPDTLATAVNINFTTGSGTYNWRLKNRCAVGNESAYVNGTNFTV